jgi:hypothetical protein
VKSGPQAPRRIISKEGERVDRDYVPCRIVPNWLILSPGWVVTNLGVMASSRTDSKEKVSHRPSYSDPSLRRRLPNSR